MLFPPSDPQSFDYYRCVEDHLGKGFGNVLKLFK
jgi:hypothetical protein